MSIDKSNELDRTLNHVMDMLKYAEAKNTILLTFEAGMLYGTLSAFSECISENFWYLLFGSSLYLSIFILLVSFIPNLLKTNNRTLSKNIQYFGDIADLNFADYTELYDKKLINNDEFYEDLLCQIHYNSKIAVKKFRTFKLAVCVLFVLPVVLRIVVIIYQKISSRMDKV